MQGGAPLGTRVASDASAASAVAALFLDQCDRDTPMVSIPRPEVHLVVRFGPSARDGLDVHASGGQQTARRKLIRAGQRTVMARLHLGTQEAVLGVPASAIAGRVVPLDELWGDAPTRRLLDRLTAARATADAAAILERTIADRLAMAGARRVGSQLAIEAAERLATASVSAVAVELGVSERHLRRRFREAIGMSPKTFARLVRFHRALRAASAGGRPCWGSIAVAAGYYDQAHLIDEFRAIAGVTPPTLLGELGARAAEFSTRGTGP